MNTPLQVEITMLEVLYGTKTLIGATSYNGIRAI